LLLTTAEVGEHVWVTAVTIAAQSGLVTGKVALSLATPWAEPSSFTGIGKLFPVFFFF